MIRLLNTTLDKEIFHFHHIEVLCGNFGILGRLHNLKILGIIYIYK